MLICLKARAKGVQETGLAESFCLGAKVCAGGWGACDDDFV